MYARYIRASQSVLKVVFKRWTEPSWLVLIDHDRRNIFLIIEFFLFISFENSILFVLLNPHIKASVDPFIKYKKNI